MNKQGTNQVSAKLKREYDELLAQLEFAANKLAQFDRKITRLLGDYIITKDAQKIKQIKEKIAGMSL